MTQDRIPGIDDGTNATEVSTTQVGREARLDAKTYDELRQIATRLRQTLARIAPGTSLRDGLDRILRGRTGALLVLAADADVGCSGSPRAA